MEESIQSREKLLLDAFIVKITSGLGFKMWTLLPRRSLLLAKRSINGYMHLTGYFFLPRIARFDIPSAGRDGDAKRLNDENKEWRERGRECNGLNGRKSNEAQETSEQIRRRGLVSCIRAEEPERGR